VEVVRKVSLNSDCLRTLWETFFGTKPLGGLDVPHNYRNAVWALFKQP